jgi:hypothetical protein
MATQEQRDVDAVAVVPISDVRGPADGRPDGRLPSAVLRDHLLATAADTDAGVLLLDDGHTGPLPQTAVVAAWTRMAARPSIPVVLVSAAPAGTLPAQVPVAAGVVEATEVEWRPRVGIGCQTYRVPTRCGAGPRPGAQNPARRIRTGQHPRPHLDHRP